MAVRCARHDHTTYHKNVAEVRACFNGQTVATVARDSSWLKDASAEVSQREPEYDAETYNFRPAQAGSAAFDSNTLESGIYLLGEEIYKVQKAVHGSGNMYAKRLVISYYAEGKTGNFEYAPGTVRKLRPEHKMSLDQAKEFGALYGVCCRCGRTLTDEESIANGIGPICASKF